MRGNLLRMEDAEGNVTRFRYDGFGNLASATDAEGNVTAYSYNGRGERLTETRTLFLRDQNGEFLLDEDGENLTEAHQTRWVYDDEGRILTMIDAEDYVTYYEYDGPAGAFEQKPTVMKK